MRVEYTALLHPDQSYLKREGSSRAVRAGMSWPLVMGA